MNRPSHFYSGGESIERCAANGKRPVRATVEHRSPGNAEWRALSNGRRSAKSLMPLAFLARLELAQAALYRGVPQSEVREQHGAIVLQAAIEANRAAVQ